jgi:hypothetical protein
MIEALRFQAAQRAPESLWRPRQVARRTAHLVEVPRPDAILVDHLAFAATIGLRSLGASYGDVVVGHPTALPVDGEVYGLPSAWPPSITPGAVELESLRAEARGVTEAFTHVYNMALHALEPAAPAVDDAFAAHGDLVLFNYPAEIHPPMRTARLPRHVFLGSAVRSESPDEQTRQWLAQADGRPLVIASFGTFLAARTDVLARVVAALRRLDVRVALAVGSSDRAVLGELPPAWLVRPHVPQVALLEHADLLITHGGNNSVTEALTFGVPMLMLPFSTDQFDGAAAVERAIAGVALDPNSAPRSLIAGSIRGLLRSPPGAPAAIGSRLRREPGPEVAFAAMAEGGLTPGHLSLSSPSDPTGSRTA